jgi:hypothetical protein
VLKSYLLKGLKLKIVLTIIIASVLCVLTGCNGAAEVKEPLREDAEVFTVDFEKGRTLRYKFASGRQITLDWGTAETSSKSGRTVDRSSESMDMVVAYTPIEVDPYGLTTIKATCESVEVRRSTRKGRQAAKDAVKSLVGKTFTLAVHPNGKIEDYSQLEQLIQETGKKAFRPQSRQGRIKEPDMISDFTATQWFLWDSVSSIEKPAQGVSVGQTWKSILSVPSPMVMKEARDVTYKLESIRGDRDGRFAVIHSSYAPAESAPRDWPMPYEGAFQVSGKFGFLRGFKILGLKGEGEELFDIDAGRIERYNQRYRMRVAASLLFPLPGANPKITINQKLTMQLIKD